VDPTVVDPKEGRTLSTGSVRFFILGGSLVSPVPRRGGEGPGREQSLGGLGKTGDCERNVSCNPANVSKTFCH
jgi:hypothetical protein